MADASASRACIPCSACAMHPLCHPREAHRSFQSPVECRRRVERGEAVYGPLAPRSSLLAVRAGSLKSSMADRVGGAHILRFIFAGEIAGLGALSSDAPAVELVALEASEVCVIPAYRAQMRAGYSSAIASHLVNLLSAELTRTQAHATNLARLDAAARVARYLLDHARDHAALGVRGALPLPMGRRELGEHLNLTIESTSRILCEFQARGWIRLARGTVEILRPDALDSGSDSGSDPDLARRNSRPVSDISM